MASLLQGYWREWIPWCPCRRPTRPERLSCQRVRGRAKHSYSFVDTEESRRTVRGAKFAANQEVYQKIYGPAVEIVAVDDLINGNFTAVLKGGYKFFPQFQRTNYAISRC